MARKIQLNGKTYTWKVGRSNIVIRSEDGFFKKIIAKDSILPKYFVVYHNWDSPSLYSARKFDSKDEAQKYLQECRKLEGPMKESYSFSSTRFSAITPATIKDILLSEKVSSKKTCRCGRFERIEDCIACLNN